MEEAGTALNNRTEIYPIKIIIVKGACLQRYRKTVTLSCAHGRLVMGEHEDVCCIAPHRTDHLLNHHCMHA